MHSELKEFLEWTKTVRRQFEIDMDETWVTKPSIERVAIENLLIAYDQMADRLRTPSPSGGIRSASEIYGYVFNGKFFKSLDDMRGMTMSEDNKPTPVFIHNQFAGDGFQSRVLDWLLKCFGAEIAKDVLERNDRFIEESLELVQALGYNADRAHALVDYVFSRPKGEAFQEVGGVMVTLAALCSATGLNMAMDGELEYARISKPEIIEKIRKKQAAKPTGSALPIALPQNQIVNK